ncbi:hypothetical protein [Anaerolinea sp.]|uniref:hypothetical protein n=1 Tax=Anaerolinea sp. TaxID=1872519 RepID=UPI002ACD426F|nr:hypothetical protein [Anaerolinea sp.]
MNESLELGFEVSKLLAHSGYQADAPAFSITWGQIAEEIARIVIAHNLPSGQLTKETVVVLADDIRRDIQHLDPLNWREVVLDRVMTCRAINPALWEPEYEPDEGPLVEQYENATRLGDDESFWVDGGESADFFEE